MTQEEQEKVALLEAKCAALQLRLDTVTETLEFTNELKQQADRCELIARKANEELTSIITAKDQRIRDVGILYKVASEDRDRARKTIIELEGRIRQIAMSPLASDLRIAKAENKELKAKLRDVQELLKPKKERKSK